MEVGILVVMVEEEELRRRGKVGVGLAVAVVMAWDVASVMGEGGGGVRKWRRWWCLLEVELERKVDDRSWVAIVATLGCHRTRWWRRGRSWMREGEM